MVIKLYDKELCTERTECTECINILNVLNVLMYLVITIDRSYIFKGL